MLSFINSVSGGEIELKYLRQIGPGRGLAIDVGAAIGYYSYVLARLYRQVVSFEPNLEVVKPLVAAKIGNVRIINEGLSSSRGEAILHIPISNGVKLPGWASLNDRNCPGATEFDRRQIRLSSLDDHQFYDVGFIKIDVEGHELDVLRGAEQTLRRDHPHLLIEVRDDHLGEVRAMLTGWGYRETTLEEIGGPPGSPGNLIFVPAEKRAYDTAQVAM